VRAKWRFESSTVNNTSPWRMRLAILRGFLISAMATRVLLPRTGPRRPTDHRIRPAITIPEAGKPTRWNWSQWARPSSCATGGSMTMAVIQGDKATSIPVSAMALPAAATFRGGFYGQFPGAAWLVKDCKPGPCSDGPGTIFHFQDDRWASVDTADVHEALLGPWSTGVGAGRRGSLQLLGHLGGTTCACSLPRWASSPPTQPNPQTRQG